MTNPSMAGLIHEQYVSNKMIRSQSRRFGILNPSTGLAQVWVPPAEGRDAERWLRLERTEAKQ